MKLWAVILFTVTSTASYGQDCWDYETNLVDSVVQRTCSYQKDTIVLDSFPAFPGGIDSFKQFLSRKQYPDSFYISGEARKVYLRFCIRQDGSIGGVQPYPGTEELNPPDFNEEAIQLLHSSPLWKAGYLNGEPLYVCMVSVIVFEVDEPRKWRRILKIFRKRLIQKA